MPRFATGRTLYELTWLVRSILLYIRTEISLKGRFMRISAAHSVLSDAFRFKVFHAVGMAVCLIIVLTLPPASATVYSTYRCAQICKYAQSALWFDVNGSYRIIESVRYRGGTDNCGSNPRQLDYWFVSGSDVRSDLNSIKWSLDRLPANSVKTQCDPFDAGALIAATQMSGATTHFKSASNGITSTPVAQSSISQPSIAGELIPPPTTPRRIPIADGHVSRYQMVLL